jgi:hypothetical protein
MDIYSPGPPSPATYIGTFDYGPDACRRENCPSVVTCLPCANMWIQLVELENNEVANSTILEGSGVNPSTLREIFPARLGSVWSARIDISMHTPVLTTTLLHTSAAAATPFTTTFGEVLIDRTQRLTAALPGEGAYTNSIPPDTSLVGFIVYMQGTVHPPSSPLYLTNALRVRVGY